MANGQLSGVNEQVYAGATPPGCDTTAPSKAIAAIVAGVCFIHSFGFVHRYLCPENIFVDESWDVGIGGFEMTPPGSSYDADELKNNGNILGTLVTEGFVMGVKRRRGEGESTRPYVASKRDILGYSLVCSKQKVGFFDADCRAIVRRDKRGSAQS
jgi:hypothetical protein